MPELAGAAPALGTARVVPALDPGVVGRSPKRSRGDTAQARVPAPRGAGW